MLRGSAQRTKPLLSFYGGPFLYHLWQVQAPRAALIIEVSRLLRAQAQVISSDQSTPLGINDSVLSSGQADTDRDGRTCRTRREELRAYRPH